MGNQPTRRRSMSDHWWHPARLKRQTAPPGTKPAASRPREPDPAAENNCEMSKVAGSRYGLWWTVTWPVLSRDTAGDEGEGNSGCRWRRRRQRRDTWNTSRVSRSKYNRTLLGDSCTDDKCHTCDPWGLSGADWFVTGNISKLRNRRLHSRINSRSVCRRVNPERSHSSYTEVLYHGNPGTSLWRPLRALGHCSGPYREAPKLVQRHCTTPSGPGRVGRQRCPTRLLPMSSSSHMTQARYMMSATPSVTGRHRTTGNVHTHRTPSIPCKMHRPAQQTRKRFSHTVNNQTTQDNSEKQWPGHLQDFNWSLASVHNPDTCHPASMAEYDGARSHTDWRSHMTRSPRHELQPTTTHEPTCQRVHTMHCIAIVTSNRSPSLVSPATNKCGPARTESPPGYKSNPDTPTATNIPRADKTSCDRARLTYTRGTQSDHTVSPLNTHTNPNRYTRSDGRLINSGLNSGAKSRHKTVVYSSGKPTSEWVPPGSQQYLRISARTGCSGWL